MKHWRTNYEQYSPLHSPYTYECVVIYIHNATNNYNLKDQKDKWQKRSIGILLSMSQCVFVTRNAYNWNA